MGRTALARTCKAEGKGCPDGTGFVSFVRFVHSLGPDNADDCTFTQRSPRELYAVRGYSTRSPVGMIALPWETLTACT